MREWSAPAALAAILVLLVLPNACNAVLPAPSALAMAERQSDLLTERQRLNEKWGMRLPFASSHYDGTSRVPSACAERVSAFMARDGLLESALFQAAMRERGREMYDLMGEQIKLMQDLDLDLDKRCQQRGVL